MPNHVINILKIKTKEPKKVIEELGENIDFEKIVPMPDNIFRGNLGQRERELYGENNWYDWSLKNWGTKWNAYDQAGPFEGENYVEYIFSTAWSCPFYVYVALAKKYDIEVKYADEDIGFNCGRIKSKNGVIIIHKTAKDYKDSRAYANKVWRW